MDFKRIFSISKNNLQRIVLPEGTEERVITAADIAISEGLAEIFLIGKTAEIKAKAAELNLQNIGKATIVDTETNPKMQEYTNLLFELRKGKGMTFEDAKKLVENPLYLACLMIKNGDADGNVAGASNLTSNVLRPALQIIKTRPDVSVVSGAMLMFVRDKNYGDNGLVIFADCAVNPSPTSEELAQIAVCTAETASALAGVNPKVAMLSFSSKGSAKHETIDKIVKAVDLAKKMDPNLQIDGEMQSDTALVPSVGANKAPGSHIAGQANVLIFPDLQSGNISYKLVQRLGNAEAVGPILQGMAAPVNDLSRGCSVDDIIKMIAITSVQAIQGKKMI